MRRIVFTGCVAVVAVMGVSSLAVRANAQQPPAGSYQSQCRNTHVANGLLTGECADVTGQFRPSLLAYATCQDDITVASTGALQCIGAPRPNEAGDH